MTEENAVWNDDLEEELKKAGEYPNREEQSQDEDIQSAILHLETQLESIRGKLREHELTKNEAKKIFGTIENIQKEIAKLKS